jgi:hypothetical protein
MGPCIVGQVVPDVSKDCAFIFRVKEFKCLTLKIKAL